MITPIYQLEVRSGRVHLIGKEEVLEAIKCLTQILQEDEDSPPWMMVYGYSDNPPGPDLGAGGRCFLKLTMKRVDLIHQPRLISSQQKLSGKAKLR